MPNYYGPNHASLPAIPSPYSPPNYRPANHDYSTQMTPSYVQPNPPQPNYRPANPDYSAQMTPRYVEPNPPQPNNLTFNYGARNGNHSSNKPRDKICYTAFRLCGSYQRFELEPSEHSSRLKNTLKKWRCQDCKACQNCYAARHQLGLIISAPNRERFQEFLNNELIELWAGKNRLFVDGFVDSDDTPPSFNPTQIMDVILEAPNNFKEERKIEKSRKNRRRQQREQQRQRESTAEVASELPLRIRSSQMARTHSFSPDNEQDHHPLMVRSYLQPLD
ncbi:uncharacterized protein EAF02_010296 [Botrytis sinoallii]|uniref:uncharacterized protein n=1 Tax=Botrytis sinoallii TaxID=1463999 RepID=UPI0018FF3188|nr:uncharacterized protein EAF02_010296 [Botrytis sinoallii]KAF7864328.1 hypothetical protein EAF02_010296 [Botrytis sinoallii]